MKRFGLKAVATAFVAFIAFASTAGAQVTTGNISGRVTDESGKPIEGAQVQVKNVQTNLVRARLTNADGRYVILGLEVGSGYSVTVRRIGLEAQARNEQSVALGTTTRADFSLKQAATTLQGVRIIATTDPVIAPSKTGVGVTVSDSLLHRMPTLNRNFTDMVALTPQVSLNGAGLSGGGVNNRYNTIQIDGASETDLFGLGSTGQPGGQAGGKSIGIESVKQYQVLLSPYDVREGNFAGALINAVTKSGSNEFHGSIYDAFRSQSLTRTEPYLSDYHQTQYGFTLGGPIVKDKIFFFVNPEYQLQNAPSSGCYIGLTGCNLQQADLTRFETLATGYGVPTGSAGPIFTKNPLTNIFARLDFQDLPFNSTLMVRYNYGGATQDVFSRGSTGSTPSFPLSSNEYQFISVKRALVAQLRSNFKNGAYNELFLGYTTIRDVRAPVAIAPQLNVTVPGATLVTGSERSSQANSLAQNYTELTDNFTFPLGNAHRVTIGSQNFLNYQWSNVFGQNIYGNWTFANLDSLASGQPSSYNVGVGANGTSGAVSPSAQQVSAYVQDEWNATNRLTVTYGLRVDIPSFGTKPPLNQEVLTDFGKNTSSIPSGQSLLSYRVGFNWDVTGDQRNQLRGGAGIFTGRPAFVWMSNMFGNTGGLSGFAQLTCLGSYAPKFNSTSAAHPPTVCGNGVTATAGSEIDLMQSNVKFPQTQRESIGFDRDLGNGWVGTVEGLLTQNLNDFFYQNIALAGPQGTDPNGRVMYGSLVNTPILKILARNRVLEAVNTNKNWGYNWTVGVQRKFRDNFEFEAWYTRSEEKTSMDPTSSTQASQTQFGRAWAGNLQDQAIGTSLFQQDHRIIMSGTYRFQPTLTDISLIYSGRSGNHYDYVYGGGSGDLNGDGFTGNDLVYVPKSTTDSNQVFLVPLGTTTTATEAAALQKFIAGNKCLSSQAGTIMQRNSCVAPWIHEIDVSLRQSLAGLGIGSALNTHRLDNVTVQLDVFNLANLINSGWGKQEYTGAIQSVNLLTYVTTENRNGKSLIGPTGVAARPEFTFDPNTIYTTANNISSNYRMQVSLRYSF